VRAMSTPDDVLYKRSRDGVVVGVDDGVGVGENVGEGVSVGEGDGVGENVGDGVDVGVVDGVGVDEGVGDGVGVCVIASLIFFNIKIISFILIKLS
jgi:hypothetical protein